MMGFEKTGPYRLSRSDLIVASLMVSFLMGARSVRIRSACLVLLGLLIFLGCFAFGYFWQAGIGLFLIVEIFVLIPALRYRRDTPEITLSYDPEGIVAETSDMRTIYKWATLGEVRRVGPRLFVMINKNCALVLASRFVDDENMARIGATLTECRSPYPQSGRASATS